MSRDAKFDLQALRSVSSDARNRVNGLATWEQQVVRVVAASGATPRGQTKPLLPRGSKSQKLR